MTLLEMKAGRYLIPVDITASKGRLYLNFGYNKKLLAEIKLMKGRRYHGYDDIRHHWHYGIGIYRAS